MAADISTLEDRIRGRVVVAADHGWDEARAAFNLLIDQQPDLVVFPEDAADVSAIVSWAAEAGVRVSAQTTGHRAGTIGSLSGTALIKTERLDDVRVDADAQTVRAGAGVVWSKVVAAAAPAGLAVLSGTAGGVGVAGYTLGGGIGWLGREYGLASNHVVAIEVVTADGEIRRVDPANDPDLFWALRGGGGDFGIITAIEMRAFAIESVYAGSFFWPVDRAAEVFEVWSEWAGQTPDQLSSCARFFNFPPLELIPEPFRGRSLVSVEIVFNGSTEQGRRLTQPLAALGPELGGCGVMPAASLIALHQDPPNPGPSVGDGILLEHFSGDVVRALCDCATSETGRRLVSIEVRQTGGAMGRAAVGAGVLTSLPGAYAVYAAGVAAPGVDPAELHASVAEVKRAVRPAATTLGYTNFSHEPTDLSPFFASADLSRLRDVKRRYDPGNVVRGTNPVPD